MVTFVFSHFYEVLYLHFSLTQTAQPNVFHMFKWIQSLKMQMNDSSQPKYHFGKNWRLPTSSSQKVS